ncbi:MAG: nucleotide sugar dehydrogenase [Akkermansiaceae bacterium]|nr:nucleotide sugar dehydrogenase [Akkermansiaceae bacterium]
MKTKQPDKSLSCASDSEVKAPLPAGAPAAAVPAETQVWTADVIVIGLGYVGLPLSMQFASVGLRVLGLDIDPEKVRLLTEGTSYIKHIESRAVSELRRIGRLAASTDFSRVREASAVVICVPTPLGKHRDPDISYVLKTAESVAAHLAPGTLVARESTTYPGTTEGELRRVLEEGSGMTAGKDFHLAYSPEREDPGNPASKVGSVPKLVGGYTPACLEKAMKLYSRALDHLVPVASCQVAEAAKLLENIFRSVNIALVNELKVVYAAMGIDIWEVIEAAKTKPFGFMPFYPGPGLGGHCIPIDPFYLTWKAREFAQDTRFIELAGEINSAMPRYVMSRAIDALNAHGKSVNGSRVLLIGLAYKPNVDDERESPSYALMQLFAEGGAAVEYFDPYVPVIGMTREHASWAGKESVEWNRKTIESFDLVLIATAHNAIRFGDLAAWAQCIVDTRNAMSGTDTADGQVWKA